MGFVANFTRFPAMQEVWKSAKIRQSYREYKGGNFFETQCINKYLKYTSGAWLFCVYVCRHLSSSLLLVKFLLTCRRFGLSPLWP